MTLILEFQSEYIPNKDSNLLSWLLFRLEKYFVINFKRNIFYKTKKNELKFNIFTLQ